MAGPVLTLDQQWQVGTRSTPGQVPPSLSRGKVIEVKDAAAIDGARVITVSLTLNGIGHPSGEGLAFETGSFNSHYKLHINGTSVHDSRAHSGGAPGDPGYTSIVAIPFSVTGGQVLLRYQFDVRADQQLLMETAPRVGPVNAIVGARAWMQVAMLLLVGAMLFAASLHLVIFTVTRDSLSSLTFAVFTALFGIRTLVIEPLAPHVLPYIGTEALWRINFATTILLGPASYWFFAHAFPHYISRAAGHAILIFCGFGAVVCAAGPYDLSYLYLKAFQLVALGLILLILHGIVRSALAREPGAKLAAIGWLCSALPAIHDIMVDAKIIHGMNLLPFGFLAFFLCLSGLLASRFHHAYRRTESLAVDLRLLNEALETRITERTQELSAKLSLLQEQQVQLETARKAAVAANQAKSRFLANMSHELRTPLNAILGFSEIIRDRIFGEAAQARYSAYAGDIHRSGQHLLRLINDILDLSKIEAGKLELRPKMLRVSDEVQCAVELVTLAARSKSVSLDVSVSDDLEVLADQRALQQILLNLLSNAVKFTPEGGKVAVTSRRDGTFVSLRVADTGIGIAPQDLERVLENFGQAAHDVTTREERGTGLGLPIAKGLAEAHGGHLHLASVLGQGTTVTITLPASAAARIPSAERGAA